MYSSRRQSAFLVVSADIDHDGHPDVIYEDPESGDNLHVLRNKGDSAFTREEIISPPPGFGTMITVEDHDGDPAPDLVLGP